MATRQSANERVMGDLRAGWQRIGGWMYSGDLTYGRVTLVSFWNREKVWIHNAGRRAGPGVRTGLVHLPGFEESAARRAVLDELARIRGVGGLSGFRPSAPEGWNPEIPLEYLVSTEGLDEFLRTYARVFQDVSDTLRSRYPGEQHSV